MNVRKQVYLIHLDTPLLKDLIHDRQQLFWQRTHYHSNTLHWQGLTNMQCIASVCIGGRVRSKVVKVEGKGCLPPQLTRGSGERSNLSQWGLGWSTSWKRFWCIFSFTDTSAGNKMGSLDFFATRKSFTCLEFGHGPLWLRHCKYQTSVAQFWWWLAPSVTEWMLLMWTDALCSGICFVATSVYSQSFC